MSITISKARYYYMGYVSAATRTVKQAWPRIMHDTSASTSKTTGWLRRDLRPGRGVTVKISEGCLTMIADSDEVQKLRKELYQVKQLVNGIRNGMFSAINES